MMTIASMNLKRLDGLDKGVVALLVRLGPLERDNDSEHRRLDSSRAWQHSWYVSIVLMASAVWYSFFDLAVPQTASLKKIGVVALSNFAWLSKQLL